MKQELKDKLDNVVGKPYNYHGKNITIEKYKEVAGTNVVIFVNGSPFKNLYFYELEEFLNDLCVPAAEILKPQQIAVPEQKLKVFEPTKENEEIKQTLMDTLKKIKADASYIPQATAICNVVSQIVTVQKTEIQMLQLLNKK